MKAEEDINQTTKPFCRLCCRKNPVLT